MHDLVYDLVRAILAHQVNDKGNGGGDRCRYAVLTDCSNPLQLSGTSPTNIKTLHFLDCGELELCGDPFSLAKCLHILDLSGCVIHKLPDSISQLKQLRFLHAPRIQDQMIPNCITELSELTYLNLRGSRKISALPESIGHMKGLMHLDLSGCKKIHVLPKSFAELKQLVYLNLSHCRMSISEAIGGFTKLQYLNLSVKFSYSTKHRREPLEVIKNLNKLRYLNLSGYMNVMAPSEDQIGSLLGSISTLSNLEHLDLSENMELSSIPESIGNLRKLHTLDLSGCSDLEKLPGSITTMVCLKVLNADARLHESLLPRSNFASLPHFVVHASTDKCSSNMISLQPTNPVDLRIARIENVKSAKVAQSIKLIEKQKLRYLTFEWTVGAKRFVSDKEVLEKLVPPSSVQRLSIHGYRSVSIPDWLMGIKLCLPNLLQIELQDFPKCNYLPPFGELPNLEHLSLCHMEGLEEWNTSYTMFPKLEELRIIECPKLRIKPCLPRAMSLYIQDSDNVLPSFREDSSLSRRAQDELSVHGSNLNVSINSKVPLHQWRLLHQLPALRSLSITNCSDLTASPEIIQYLSSLQSMTLKEQAELPSWLVELTSLHVLSLYSCGSLTSLPQWLVKLTSLQSLRLSYCNGMASLPQWLGVLASLKRFEISYCEGIRSLPDSIQQLTKLDNLRIDGCPPLVKWCESEENKMKLAHCLRKMKYIAAHELAERHGTRS